MALPDKQNVVVTGGAGFIGSFLCERLLADGYRVICIDSLITSTTQNIDHLLKVPDFEFLRADITQPIDLEAYPELERFKVRFQGVQTVYHLACPTSIKKFDELRMQTLLANSVGMRNVLDLAVKYKAKFYQSSTSLIYGFRPADGHLFEEKEFGSIDHLTPRSCYDTGKFWAETMAKTYADVHGLDVRIARVFRTYGPRMPLSDGHMIPDFILAALDGKDMVIYGTEEFRTSLAYVTDVVDGIVRLMENPTNPGPVNLGSDYDIKLVDVANRIKELVGSSSNVVFEKNLPFMRDLGLPNLTKAKADLGWIPLVSLEQGLKKTIEYTQANRSLLRATFGS
jgi:UDP-glucuronate decarboxylase